MEAQAGLAFLDMAKGFGIDFGVVTVIVLLINMAKEKIGVVSNEEKKKKLRKWFPVMSLVLAIAWGLVSYWGQWWMVAKVGLAYTVAAGGLYDYYKMYIKTKPKEEIKNVVAN